MSKNDHKEYVIREFDRAARGYDESRLVRSYQRRVQTIVISRMDISKGMNVLDLGCGTGWGAIDIASKLGGTGTIIGLDVSPKMIEEAKRNLEALDYDNVEFTVGCGESLNYVDFFDYVISTNAFHHFSKKEVIFSNVWRSLKRDGIFIIQDICDDYLLMRMVDIAGKIGEKAHIGSTSSEFLRELFLKKDFIEVTVEKMKFNWFWGIMIGMGKKPGQVSL